MSVLSPSFSLSQAAKEAEMWRRRSAAEVTANAAALAGIVGGGAAVYLPSARGGGGGRVEERHWRAAVAIQRHARGWQARRCVA
eukprot:1194655-Prorocentrum_minimum.AAC.4